MDSLGPFFIDLEDFRIGEGKFRERSVAVGGDAKRLHLGSGSRGHVGRMFASPRATRPDSCERASIIDK